VPIVVTYWRFPEEEPPFLDYLEKSGPVLAVDNQHVSSPGALTPRPLREVIEKDPQAILLLLAQYRDLLNIVPFQKDGATLYSIHAMRSPVIDYLRGKWRAPNKLGQSNISAYSDYPDERGSRLIQHPKDHVAWAKRVSAWVRKSTPFWHKYKSYRVSPPVHEAVLKSSLELVP
jgi:hypothetical protein